MRSVVLSIAVHAALGALVVMKVTMQSHVVVEEPHVTEIELYVEPRIAEPAHEVTATVAAHAHEIAATRKPASHAVSRGGAVVEAAPVEAAPVEAAPVKAAPVKAAPVNAIESSPTPVTAPAVVTLPSPRDAVATMNVPAPSSVETTPPAATAANTFRMRVDAGGNAHLSDRRNFQWGTGGSLGRVEEVKAERWLEEHHEQSNVVDMKLPPLTTVVTFDVGDAAMRLAGQDPYAYEKLKVLDATRNERAQIGARHHERQLLDTPALVRASLANIARLPADQRAAAIIALYRECDDSPAGEVARTTIAEYVHAHGLAIELR